MTGILAAMISSTTGGGATLDLIVSYPNVYAIASGPNIQGLVSGQVGAPTFTNGSGLYSYAWTLTTVSSGLTTPTINLATTQRPTFSANVREYVDSVSTWHVVVTDTGTGKVATDDITVRLVWINTGTPL
jgi:hypothetical protein